MYMKTWIHSHLGKKGLLFPGILVAMSVQWLSIVQWVGVLGALLGKILKGEGVGSSCFFIIFHFLLLMSQKEDVMTRAPAAKVACEVLLNVKATCRGQWFKMVGPLGLSYEYSDAFPQTSFGSQRIKFLFWLSHSYFRF